MVCGQRRPARYLGPSGDIHYGTGAVGDPSAAGKQQHIGPRGTCQQVPSLQADLSPGRGRVQIQFSVGGLFQNSLVRLVQLLIHPVFHISKKGSCQIGQRNQGVLSAGGIGNRRQQQTG